MNESGFLVHARQIGLRNERAAPKNWRGGGGELGEGVASIAQWPLSDGTHTGPGKVRDPRACPLTKASAVPGRGPIGLGQRRAHIRTTRGDTVRQYR